MNIPCSMECKIVGQILIDHALSYALTMTTDVPAVETITYTVDMFRDTLKLPVETPDNPFIKLAKLKFIQRFLEIVGYEGIVDKKKDVIQCPRFTKIIIADLMKKFPFISNISLVSVYTIGNVAVRGMLIPCDFISDDIHATMKYKEYEKVFVGIDVPIVQPQLVESTQGMSRTPRATRRHSLTTEVAQKKCNIKAVAGESSTPRKSLKVIIKQKKPSTTTIPPLSDDRERDEITEATLLKDDFGTKIEPESHKENSEVVIDDDVDDNVDKEKKNDDVEEKKDEKNEDNDNHADHTLVRREVAGSLGTRNEQMQTPIPSPPRSSRTDLSLDKTLSEELTANVSPTPDTTSKYPNMSQPTSSTSKILSGSVAELSKMKEMSDILNNLVPELTVAKTNELIKEAVPRMVNDAAKHDQDLSTDVIPELVSKEFATHALKIIEELFKLHMKNKVLNVHPTVSISNTKTTADLKQQLYLKMKTDLQA
ncbi:hypothetical protein Tco_1088913 [Tanacetum coccineum]